MGTSTVSSETDRLAALQAYEVLDSPAEPDFDELALLAARICETPIALVTLVVKVTLEWRTRREIEEAARLRTQGGIA